MAFFLWDVRFWELYRKIKKKRKSLIWQTHLLKMSMAAYGNDCLREWPLTGMCKYRVCTKIQTGFWRWYNKHLNKAVSLPVTVSFNSASTVYELQFPLQWLRFRQEGIRA